MRLDRLFPTLLCVALGLLPNAIASQAPIRAQKARLEGDVYLITSGGDIKRGAGRTVFLLREEGPNGDQLRVQADRICTEIKSRVRQWSAWDLDLIDNEMRISTRQPLIDPTRVKALQRALATQAIAYGLEMRDSILKLLRRAIVDSIGTGVAARFEFPSVSAGRYALLATWQIGGSDYVWFSPLTMKASVAAKHDLDNSKLDQTLLCPAVDSIARKFPGAFSR
jgi:hypothetical protein